MQTEKKSTAEKCDANSVTALAERKKKWEEVSGAKNQISGVSI